MSGNAIFPNISHLLHLKKMRRDQDVNLEFFPWVLWEIWKNRNNIIFKNQSSTGIQIVVKAKEDHQSWLKAHRDISKSQSPDECSQGTSVKVWCQPSFPELKCNVDFSWIHGDFYCGAAWVLRNSLGEVSFHGRQAFLNSETWIQAGVLAMQWATECLHTLGYQNVAFETDSKGLFEAIAAPHQWPSVIHMVLESPILSSLMDQHRLLLCARAYIARGSFDWFNPLVDIDKPLALC